MGVGVAIACKGETEDLTGVIAAACALVSVVLGKYLMVYFIVAGAVPSDAIAADSSDVIEMRAWEIVGERKAAGKSVGMPNNKTSDEATYDDLPADIRDEARRHWEQLSDADKEAKLEQISTIKEAFVTSALSTARSEGFKESFTPLTFLWFFLAAATAYKLGAGKSDD
ncbi:MAG: hypothetical protein QM775_23570 [Pirellulales bacterium]